MKNLILLILVSLFFPLAKASEHQMIDSLGASPKGQFVALEEYGYKDQGHRYYVRIKIMNVWKKEYVGKFIEVELPAVRPSYLGKARARARFLAQDELQKFDIKG